MNPAKIVPLLLDWFARNARDLPWRRTHDPYAIWVSEIMLQQTQVKTVLPYWERWMRTLPTIDKLASAKPQKIHKLWEGLGYYTRVSNMQNAARLIIKKHQARFPVDFDAVLDLPGIGLYTAGAICSIAFNQPRPILDGNVIRVLTRLCGIDGNPRERALNARLWQLAERLVRAAHTISAEPSPHPHAGDRCAKIANRKSQIVNHAPLCSHLNQSLMELGALVCTPRRPRCDVCPVAKLCVARKERRVDQLPSTPPRAPATRRRFVAFVINRDGEFLVRQRPAGVVNAHLWEFPNIEVANEDGDPRQAALSLFGIVPENLTALCTLQHSITRYRIRLDVLHATENCSVRLKGNVHQWATPSQLRRIPFASAHAKILKKLISPSP
jgi:A/G-specific adenine glycosylase